MSIKCLMNGLEVNYPCSPACALFGDCVTAFEAHKKENVRTNADRIRAMSDEELCSVVRLAAYSDVCYMGCECHECVFNGLCKEDEDEIYSDEQEEITAVMKWLKQPAGEE